jgi:hypothetical protein
MEFSEVATRLVLCHTMSHWHLVGRDAVVRRITISWPCSIAAILMLMVMLAMVALSTLGVFASTVNAQANGGNPPDVECAEAGGEFAGKFAETGEFTRPVNVGGTAVVISFRISGDTVTFFSEAPLEFILVVKRGQLTEEFGPTRKGTFTLSNGQDINHVTFCATLEDGNGEVPTASPTASPPASPPADLPSTGGVSPAALLAIIPAILLGGGLLSAKLIRRS